VNPRECAASKHRMKAASRRIAWTLLLGALSAAAPGLVRADPAPHDSAATGEAVDLEACAARTASRVQKRYEGVRDLEANFTQTTKPAGAVPSAPTHAKGRLVFAKPGKMRWSYEEPEPSVVVSDGTTLWIYDPAFQEVQRLPVGEGLLSGAAIQFLLGDGDIFRAFEVKALRCSEASVELELTPKEPASYERLGIVVDPRSGDLEHTRLVDLLGTVIDVDLSQVEVNQGPPPETFRFEPPPGVKVTDLHS